MIPYTSYCNMHILLDVCPQRPVFLSAPTWLYMFLDMFRIYFYSFLISFCPDVSSMASSSYTIFSDLIACFPDSARIFPDIVPEIFPQYCT